VIAVRIALPMARFRDRGGCHEVVKVRFPGCGAPRRPVATLIMADVG
jgi:hypothetical protein